MLLIIIFIFAQPNDGCTGKKGFQNGSTLKRVLVSKLKKSFFRRVEKIFAEITREPENELI